jgi:MlaC protein
MVTSQIIRLQRPPIEVDWRLAESDGRYKISDVSIDGVSMALTQRSEFAAIVQRNGGRVAAPRDDARDDLRAQTHCSVDSQGCHRTRRQPSGAHPRESRSSRPAAAWSV